MNSLFCNNELHSILKDKDGHKSHYYLTITAKLLAVFPLCSDEFVDGIVRLVLGRVGFCHAKPDQAEMFVVAVFVPLLLKAKMMAIFIN